MDVSSELVEFEIFGRVDETFLCEVIDIFWIDRGGKDAKGLTSENLHARKCGY
jgi:hypothetical protein